MAHFAVCCPESPGHVNPMLTLLKELQRRGHEITWIGLPDGEEMAKQQGFHSIVIGQTTFPKGSYDELIAELGRRSGISAVRFTLQVFRKAVEVGLREGIKPIQESGANALIADESVFGARTCADVMKLPWITICNALPFHPDAHLPPNGLAWKYGIGWWPRLRNAFGYRLGRLALADLDRLIRNFRKQHGLRPYDTMWENASELATIAQISAAFDFPRAAKPDWFHYVGALHHPTSRPAVEFPFGQLDGRPLIYASMGTAQNRLLWIFRAIAEGCRDVDAQLVISMGGGANPDDLGELPGNPVIVKYAPQLELIKRASLVITHAGMNTVAESIAAGVPMVAIPVTNDQPAVAARVQHHGCGKSIPLRAVSAKRISAALKTVLADPRFAENVRAQATANREAGGAARAAEIIEETLLSRDRE